MKLVYPACFYPTENGKFTVTVPDLQGCVTEGNDFADAMEMAIDAASGWILSSIEDNEEIPKASKITEIRADEYEQGFTSMLLLDIAAYAEKYGDKAVRKNLTIPAWLNTIAERENINFSLVLQEALQEKLLVH